MAKHGIDFGNEKKPEKAFRFSIERQNKNFEAILKKLAEKEAYFSKRNDFMQFVKKKQHLGQCTRFDFRMTRREAWNVVIS